MPRGRPRKLTRPGLNEVGLGKPKRPLAPRNVTVRAIDNVDERASLAKRHKADGWHLFYGDRTKHRDYLEDGYEPVMEEGEQVHHKGDPLYRISEATHLERRRRSEMESIAIVEQARQGQRSEDVIRDETGQTHRVEVANTLE